MIILFASALLPALVERIGDCMSISSKMGYVWEDPENAQRPGLDWRCEGSGGVGTYKYGIKNAIRMPHFTMDSRIVAWMDVLGGR